MTAQPADCAFNILHVLRAPVGGLFRHVTDLARGQAARGHRVGLVADSSTGGSQAEATLAALASSPSPTNGKSIRVYTPHGGSLHYRWGSPTGLFYLSAERALMRRTDL